MTSVDFTNWLKGYLAATKGALTAEQVAEVQAKMAEICEFTYLPLQIQPYIQPQPLQPLTPWLPGEPTVIW